MKTDAERAVGLQYFPLYTATQKGVLYVPSQMTRSDFELVKSQIENALAVVLETRQFDEAASIAREFSEPKPEEGE